MAIDWIFFSFLRFGRNALPCIPYLIHTLLLHGFPLLLYVLFVSSVFLKVFIGG